MVFSTGQLIGMAAMLLAALAVGLLLMRLDRSLSAPDRSSADAADAGDSGAAPAPDPGAARHPDKPARPAARRSRPKRKHGR